MRSFRFLVFLGLSLFSVGVAPGLAESPHAGCGMFPRNGLSFPDTGNHRVDQRIFNQILDRVSSVYTPIFQKLGARFMIERRWMDSTVNAYADASPDRHARAIHMFGGLARHPYMTPDGFLLVACHEVGHHLGGAPQYLEENPWASAEGEADYYGTLKCMRLVLEGMDNAAAVRTSPADVSARTACSGSFHNAEEMGICLRSLIAGRVLALTLNTLHSGEPRPAFNTPDQQKSPATLIGYPSTQCRLDTYVQGTLCASDPHSVPVLSAKNASLGTCDDWRQRQYGKRPQCWFNPADPLAQVANTPALSDPTPFPLRRR